MIGLILIGVFVAIGFIYIFYYCISHAKWYGDWKQFFSCFRRSTNTKAGVYSLIFWLIAFIVAIIGAPKWIVMIPAILIAFVFAIFIGREDNVKRKDKALSSIEGEISVVRCSLIEGQHYLDYKDRERVRVGFLSDKDEKTIQEVKKELEQAKIKLYDLETKLEKEKKKDLKLYNE